MKVSSFKFQVSSWPRTPLVLTTQSERGVYAASALIGRVIRESPVADASPPNTEFGRRSTHCPSCYTGTFKRPEGRAPFNSLILAAALLACGLTGLRAEDLFLTGATVHTVSGETLSPGDVLVQDGKIAALGAKLKPGKAKVIDVSGLHLYPGLIAASTTLGLVEIGGVRATRDFQEAGQYTPDVASWVSVNPDSDLLPVARANGITHFEPVPTGGTVSGMSGVVALNGWTVEDMAIKHPVALHLFWPAMRLTLPATGSGGGATKGKSPDAQAKDRQSKLKAIDDFFEEAKAYAKARQADRGKPDRDPGPVPAWEAMLPFLRGQIPLTIHADEVRQIKAAVNWAAAHNYKIILAGGRDAWMAASLLATNRVPVIYDNVFTQPARDTDPYDVHFHAPALLHNAGVKVIFSEGLDNRGAYNTRNLPYSAAQAVAFGLPAAEALKGITLYPAQVLGVADRLGSIEKGKEASFFVADGDILDLRTGVKRMWISGREVSLESRHTRLYEKYQARPAPKQ